MEASNPEINVEELMQRIRAEVAQGKRPFRENDSPPAAPEMNICVSAKSSQSEENHSAFHLNLPGLPSFAAQPAFQASPNSCYHINDLLCYHDQAFIRTAYNAVLHRFPDEEGGQHYLRLLRQGCAREDILGRLRYSKEGRAVGAKITGLAIPFLLQQIYHIPVIGRFISTIAAINNLLHLEGKQRILENDLTAFMEQAQSHFSESSKILNESLVQLEEGMRQMQSQHQEDLRNSQTALYEARHLLVQAIETRAGRQELTALGNHLNTLVESCLTKENLLPVEQLLDQLKQHVEVVSRSKTDHKAFEAEQAATRSALSAAQQKIQQALDKVRHNFTQALETRAGRQELSALSNDLRSLVAKQLTKEDLQPFEILLDELRKHVEELNRSKAAQLEFEAEQEKTSTALTAVQQRTQQALDAAKNLEACKASQEALDEASQFFAKAIERRAERQELTALSNDFRTLIAARLTKEDLLPVEQFLDHLKMQAEELNRSKAAQSSFEAEQEEIRSVLNAAQQAAQQSLSEARHLLLQAIETRAERQELIALSNHLGSQLETRLIKEDLQPFEQFLDQLKLQVEELNRSKTAQASFEAEQTDTRSALETVLQKTKQALDASLFPLKAQMHDLKRNLVDQERRLGLLLDEARKRLPKPIATRQIKAMLAEDEHRLDAIYASLEDCFRGTREDIKQRQRIYLPIVLEAKVGTKAEPIIDLGCGRGEWLELLRHEGLTARGVDINRIFLEGCRELDLDVVEQDAVTYLQSVKSNSVGAITAFQFIEHIPIKTLIGLLDESLRVLKPGGLVILETPNPANVLVGSCFFHMDPTHHKPLPLPLCKFLLEARGFVDLVGLDLNPFESTLQIPEGAGKFNEIVNQYLFGPRDFAVIGRKA